MKTTSDIEFPSGLLSSSFSISYSRETSGTKLKPVEDERVRSEESTIYMIGGGIPTSKLSLLKTYKYTAHNITSIKENFPFVLKSKSIHFIQIFIDYPNILYISYHSKFDKDVFYKDSLDDELYSTFNSNLFK